MGYSIPEKIRWMAENDYPIGQKTREAWEADLRARPVIDDGYDYLQALASLRAPFVGHYDAEYNPDEFADLLERKYNYGGYRGTNWKPPERKAFAEDVVEHIDDPAQLEMLLGYNPYPEDPDYEPNVTGRYEQYWNDVPDVTQEDSLVNTSEGVRLGSRIRSMEADMEPTVNPNDWGERHGDLDTLYEALNAWDNIDMLQNIKKSRTGLSIPLRMRPNFGKLPWALPQGMSSIVEFPTAQDIMHRAGQHMPSTLPKLPVSFNNPSLGPIDTSLVKLFKHLK